MLDNAFYFGYFENWNITGTQSQTLVGLVSLMNALRIALSMFVLLVVSLGYGVVKPTLGSDMRKCVALALALFVCCVIFNAGLQVCRYPIGYRFLKCIMVFAL
jgi:hypothetical protein